MLPSTPPATTIALTDISASIPSTSIEPYATGRAERSSESCLDVVPDATMEWNPEHAPHAMVMNSAGNRKPMLVSKPRKAGVAS